MARKPKAAAARSAAAPPPSPAAPHWQVARLAEPGQIFTETRVRGATVTVVADARGVVIPRNVEENTLVDRLPVAPAAILAAPVPDAPTAEPTDDGADAVPTEPTDDDGADAVPTEPTDDDGADAVQED